MRSKSKVSRETALEKRPRTLVPDRLQEAVERIFILAAIVQNPRLDHVSGDGGRRGTQSTNKASTAFNVGGGGVSLLG